jgi:diguanylate cyclase (GGDEF)-like protein
MGGITKPLRELAEAAKQADRGNYDFELNYSGDDEVGTLTHTFKLLSAHTKDKLSAAREKANIDALTGVKNKNAYEQRKAIIDTKIDNGEQEPFALVVCDINNLKAVNDLYGHREGDTCIKNACAKICGIFSHSPVFRIGGDEFVAILSGEDYFRRKKLMEQINAVPIDRSKIRNGETIAAGMSEYNEERHSSFTIMFEEADKAMYERKQFLKSMILPTESESDSESAYEYIPVIHARKQILIVDDMELTREMLGDLLQDDYDILYASDGVEAMDVLRSHKEDIDLVLLELQMPNKSGREVIADMQIDEDLMSIRVIFLTVDQDAELDCLKSGAMDFIPKPFPDIEILKARIDKCIELSEDRDLIRYTERDKLTGVLNKDYFFRYVSRIDHLYKDVVLDAVVCDINHFSFLNKQYGRQFCDNVLRNIGTCLRKLARKTGGIVCRRDGDTFLLYCPHQDDYEKLIEDFLADLDSEKAVTDKVDLRFGVLIDAQQYPDPEERFVRAKIAADRVIDDKQKKCGYYDLKWKQ